MRVCVCTRENMFACVQVHVHIACGGQRTSSVVFPQAGSTLFFKTGLSLAWNSASRLSARIVER